MNSSNSIAPVLITGGAVFVGANLAARLAADGRRVRVFDNLARPGVSQNRDWLRRCFGARIECIRGDIRDAEAVRQAVASCDPIFHLAAQVAVTTSLAEPRADFETNLGGSLNVLEAARAQPRPPGIVFASTNKVYGHLADLAVQETDTRYRPVEARLAAGIDETQPLAFCSPYGCSKGGADQYMLDYARTFGLPAVVFRMSCVYGPRQFGNEDQGWIAHFLRRARAGQSLTIYGNGKQVRDVLFVDDLVAAFIAAEQHLPALAGRAFNIGGGPDNTLSLIELLTLIDALAARPHVDYAAWRAADQPYYVSDTRAFGAATGWRPRVDPKAGVARLHAWLAETPRRAEPYAKVVS